LERRLSELGSLVFSGCGGLGMQGMEGLRTKVTQEEMERVRVRRIAEAPG
jgi:hypothetical protein